jgi:glutaredoxin 3
MPGRGGDKVHADFNYFRIAAASGRACMAKVEIYTSMFCGYCHAAKRLLRELEVPFIEYDVGGDCEKRAKMGERAGGRTTVPQIFINDAHVGGCDELYVLNRTGKLKRLLEQPA